VVPVLNHDRLNASARESSREAGERPTDEGSAPHAGKIA